jgi:hypothetical protein
MRTNIINSQIGLIGNLRCVWSYNQTIDKENKEIEILIKHEKIVNPLRQTESKLSMQLRAIEIRLQTEYFDKN